MNRSQIHSASRAVAPHKCKCTLYNLCCANLNALKNCKIKHTLPTRHNASLLDGKIWLCIYRTNNRY